MLVAQHSACHHGSSLTSRIHTSNTEMRRYKKGNKVLYRIHNHERRTRQSILRGKAESKVSGRVQAKPGEAIWQATSALQSGLRVFT